MFYAITYCLILNFVYGQSSQEMLENGRVQYQLLQERVNLPQYGTCWKEAVAHIHEGCRSLSEETQSDIALHLTNCFLEMSGHDTYKCELDKKTNLRGICISSMTDRAFNVYTEFYTHTQNICWFLHGQIWHETISENTKKVGKQLEDSAKNQEILLANQKESIELQEKLLKYSTELERIIGDFYLSSQKHQQILGLLSNSLSNLQIWLVGEISWFDTLIFYITAAVLIVFFTSSRRTASARLISLSLLSVNIFIERIIVYLVTRNLMHDDIKIVHSIYYSYVWFSRYTCVLLCVIILIWKVYSYKDYSLHNNILLQNIYDKLLNLSKKIDTMYMTNVENFSFVEERSLPRLINKNKKEFYTHSNCSNSGKFSPSLFSSLEKSRRDFYDYSTPKRKCVNNSIEENLIGEEELKGIGRYNLRSRNGTPSIV